jgi:NhaP-type Na+/H+ or K+/H+ antiporter
VIGLLLYGVGVAGISYPLSLWESLVFGSCLSTNDPIATLAIFQALNVDKRLYMIVLGESILNDGVGVIIYRASYYFAPGQVLSSIGNFFVVFFGSSLLGIAIALLLSGIFRLVNVARHPPLETIFMALIAYLSYVIAEAFELSGIMSVFWCGIAFNHYGAYILSA